MNYFGLQNWGTTNRSNQIFSIILLVSLVDFIIWQDDSLKIEMNVQVEFVEDMLVELSIKFLKYLLLVGKKVERVGNLMRPEASNFNNFLKRYTYLNFNKILPISSFLPFILTPVGT